MCSASCWSTGHKNQAQLPLIYLLPSLAAAIDGSGVWHAASAGDCATAIWTSFYTPSSCPSVPAGRSAGFWPGKGRCAAPGPAMPLCAYFLFFKPAVAGQMPVIAISRALIQHERPIREANYCADPPYGITCIKTEEHRASGWPFRSAGRRAGVSFAA